MKESLLGENRWSKFYRIILVNHFLFDNSLHEKIYSTLLKENEDSYEYENQLVYALHDMKPFGFFEKLWD